MSIYSEAYRNTNLAPLATVAPVIDTEATIKGDLFLGGDPLEIGAIQTKATVFDGEDLIEAGEYDNGYHVNLFMPK